MILAGDIVADEGVVLGREEMEVLSLFLRRGRHVVWIAGNHDRWAKSFALSMGFHWVNSAFHFMTGRGELVRAEHGDVYDGYLHDHPRLTHAADLAYRGIGLLSRKVAARLKHACKGYTHAVGEVEKGAVASAEEVGAGVVVCGHTHHAKIAKRGGVVYANSGSWTEPTGHYLTLARTVSLHEWK